MRLIASASPAAGPITRPMGRAVGTAAGFFFNTCPKYKPYNLIIKKFPARAFSVVDYCPLPVSEIVGSIPVMFYLIFQFLWT